MTENRACMYASLFATSCLIHVITASNTKSSLSACRLSLLISSQTCQVRVNNNDQVVTAAPKPTKLGLIITIRLSLLLRDLPS